MKFFRIVTFAFCSTLTLTSCNELLGDSDNPSGSSTKPSTSDNSEIIEFKDSYLEGLLVQYFDKNLDYKLSKAEAAAVVDIQKLLSENEYITSFDELQYFTRLKHIGYKAFYRCKNLKSITIPGSVETIYSGAFTDCSSLEKVTFLEGIQNIEESFYYVKSVTIPSSVKKLRQRPFGSKLESVTVVASNTVYDSRENCNCIIETATNTIIKGSLNAFIPSGITKIGRSAFEGIPITSIVIPASVTSFDDGVFSSCLELKSVTLPSNIKSLSNSMFGGCEALASIELPTSLQSIGAHTFDYCTALTSIEIPAGLTEIGEAAFYACENLTNMKIPGGVETIENQTFYGCKNLKSVIFEEGFKTLMESSFSHCANLESVEFPASTTNIGDAFYDCPKLKSIILKATTPPTLYSYNLGNVTIYVPAASVDTYKATERWNYLTIKSIDEL